MRFLLVSAGAGLTLTLAMAACGGSGSSGAAGTGANTKGSGGNSGNNGDLSLNGNSGNGNNFGDNNQGGGGSGGGGNCDPKVRAVVRDFKPNSKKYSVPASIQASDLGANPDFQNVSFDEPNQEKPDPNIVQAALGDDKKPVYAGGAGEVKTTHGATFFAEWFHDMEGKNKSVIYEVPLVTSAKGTRIFDSADSRYGGNSASGSGFFPLDNFPDDQTFPKDGIGDDGNPHKFSFTLEIHMEFLYNGGEIFEFTGDDDVWVFVNNKLALDLGGIHGNSPPNGKGSINFDQKAATLGIEKGKTYSFDVFQAERHTTGSNFKIETSLAFTNCQDILILR